MKKVLALMLALVFVLSLVACGGANNGDSSVGAKSSNSKKSLGETVSTDIIDFTLKEAKFSYYASSLETTYAEPIDKSDGGIFVASKGHVYVCMTFEIKNKDRDYIDAGPSDTVYPMEFDIKYNGKKYSVHSYDLNNKDGKSLYLEFGESAVSNNGGNSFSKYSYNNLVIEAEHTAIARVVGVVTLEPDDLGDSFDLIINIPDSSKKEEHYTYEI